jgi:hypothetical protein
MSYNKRRGLYFVSIEVYAKWLAMVKLFLFITIPVQMIIAIAAPTLTDALFSLCVYVVLLLVMYLTKPYVYTHPDKKFMVHRHGKLINHTTNLND